MRAKHSDERSEARDNAVGRADAGSAERCGIAQRADERSEARGKRAALFARAGLVAVMGTLAGGCGLFGARSAELPPTHAFAPCEQYAVVTEAYLFMHSEASHDSPVQYISRTGEIFEIIDAYNSQERYYAWQAPWYLVEQTGLRGWAYGASIDTHCYRYQAELQRERLLGQEYGNNEQQQG